MTADSREIAVAIGSVFLQIVALLLPITIKVTAPPTSKAVQKAQIKILRSLVGAASVSLTINENIIARFVVHLAPNKKAELAPRLFVK